MSYTSPGQSKSFFYIEPWKGQKYVVLLVRTVDIHSIGEKVWTQKNDLPQGDQLKSLIKPVVKNTKQFELTNIDDYQIKYEVERLERVDYNI